MNTHVNLTITSTSAPELSQLRPSGVTINYGVNMVPYMALDLTPADMRLMCDFESRRRKDVSVTVQTTRGCIKFDGLIDGLSFFQNVGNIQLQLIIKSPFQILLETFPRLPGFHPCSLDIFKRVETLNFNFQDDGPNYLDSITIGSTTISADKTALRFVVEAAKAFVKLQKDIDIVSTVNADVSGIIQIAHDFATGTPNNPGQLDRAAAALDRITTKYTDQMEINAGDRAIYKQILSELVNSTGSIMEFLINTLANFGCVLVIGNNAIYTIPEVGFLQSDHKDIIAIGAGRNSEEVNVAYPDQFDNITFNDNGYKDIKACYIISDENVSLLSERFTADLGWFIDERATSGGVLTLALPHFLSYGVDNMLTQITKDVQKSIKEGETNLNRIITVDESYDNYIQAETAAFTVAKLIQSGFINQWAQLKYLQSKYMDRSGNFSGPFNPRWAPGAIGTLYTRHPGVYIDFWVTSVSHKFQVSAPNIGMATTTVGFNCGRLGRSPQGEGIDRIELFNFDGLASKSFAIDFIASTLL
jgi:hypothetical protein